MTSARFILATLFIPIIYTAARTPPFADSSSETDVKPNKPANTNTLTTVRQTKPTLSSILFTADNWAALYLNGEKLADNNADWKTVKKVRAKLSEGDVLSFEVTDYGGW